MKKIILLTLLISISFALTGIVKYDSLTITLNNQTKTLKKNQKIILKYSDVICYQSGDGELNIYINKKNTITLDEDSECIYLRDFIPKKKNQLNKFKTLALNMFNSDTQIAGISRGIIKIPYTASISLNKNTKFLDISNKNYNFPVFVKLYHKNKLIKTLKFDNPKIIINLRKRNITDIKIYDIANIKLADIQITYK